MEELKNKVKDEPMICHLVKLLIGKLNKADNLKKLKNTRNK